MTIAFAAQEDGKDVVAVTGDTSSQGETEPETETTEEATEETTEEADLSFVAAEPETESQDIPDNGIVVSKDGKYKLYVHRKGSLVYADIIKYLGKDKFSNTTSINKIDGYKIRQIRSKAFCGLKTLRNVKFMGNYFSSKEKSRILKKGFYNCKKLKSLTVNSYVTLDSKCAGYVKSKKSKKFTTLKFNDVTKSQKDVSGKLKYAESHDLKAVFNVSKNNKNNRKAKLVDFLNGAVFHAKVANKTVKGWKSSNSDVIAISNKGKATIKAKGKTTLSVKVGKIKIKRVFKVTTNPYFTVKGKKTASVSVKNGCTLKVKVHGKASDIDNEFTNTDYAEVVGDADSDTFKIKGICRGKTTLKVKVNGHQLKLKVNVKKNPITDEKMLQIAQKVGCQTQYCYEDSKVMCSAYAFCYAYYQVTGSKITPGSVWCPGGCTWYGGTPIYHSSGASMLKAIKASLDKNQACVGLLSIGNSAHHYVTFYDYEGKGNKLSDFKVLDPWDGNLSTGDFYGYSRGYGYQVITINV